MVRRGCKRCFDHLDKWSPKSLLRQCNPLLHQCNPLLHQCNRLLVHIHQNTFGTLSKPLWAIMRFWASVAGTSGFTTKIWYHPKTTPERVPQETKNNPPPKKKHKQTTIGSSWIIKTSHKKKQLPRRQKYCSKMWPKIVYMSGLVWFYGDTKSKSPKSGKDDFGVKNRRLRKGRFGSKNPHFLVEPCVEMGIF